MILDAVVLLHQPIAQNLWQDDVAIFWKIRLENLEIRFENFLGKNWSNIGNFLV